MTAGRVRGGSAPEEDRGIDGKRDPFTESVGFGQSNKLISPEDL